MSDFIELLDYPGYFIAHSPGRLKRIINNIEYECKQTPNSKTDNYWSVTLKTLEGKYVKRTMHRLIMQTFVPNPLNKAHVNHKDGDKSNTDITNLEWATPKENAIHAIQTGLKTHDWAYKEVHQYNLKGDYINSYINDNAAQFLTGIPKQNISKVTLGNRKHAGYFQWSRIKHQNLPPVPESYIKTYKYGAIHYKTLNELALYCGISHPDKATLKRFPKDVRNQIEIVYYD